MSERVYRVNPELPESEYLPGVRLDLAQQRFPLSALVNVMTEDHRLLFEVVPKEPQVGGAMLHLISAEPPLTRQPLDSQVVWVEGDLLVKDREFSLSGLSGTILSQTAFRALEISANVTSDVSSTNAL